MIRSQSFVNQKAKLYIIATPIGNKSEISPRIVEAIQDASYVYCEDTRVSGSLLTSLNIHKPLISAYENIEKASASKIIEHLKNGDNVAFMSDAGYPGISDPGQLIIQEVIRQDYNIVVVNGPSALIQSVVASGFDTTHFYFYGFLNAKQSTRLRELESLKHFKDTIIFYQSPHKVKVCLEDMLAVLGDRQICLCRELTKKFEEYIRGSITEILPICETLKGEMVIVVQKSEEEVLPTEMNQAMIQEINGLIQKNIKKSEAIKQIANKYDISRSELYAFYHKGETKDE